MAGLAVDDTVQVEAICAVANGDVGAASAGQLDRPGRAVPVAGQRGPLRIVPDAVVDGEQSELLDSVGEEAALVARGRVERDTAGEAQVLDHRRSDCAGHRDQQQHRQQGGAAFALADPLLHLVVPTKKTCRIWP